MEKSFYEEIKEIMEKHKNDMIKKIINSAKKQVREAAREGLPCCKFWCYSADKWKGEYLKNFFEKEGFALTIKEDDQRIEITVYW